MGGKTFALAMGPGVDDDACFEQQLGRSGSIVVPEVPLRCFDSPDRARLQDICRYKVRKDRVFPDLTFGVVVIL